MTITESKLNKIVKDYSLTRSKYLKLTASIKTILKKSLKKTQDELEKMRAEKFQHEKRNAVLENKQKTLIWIEIFKFLSSAGVGFAINYYFIGNVSYALVVGIPSLLLFIVVEFLSNK